MYGLVVFIGLAASIRGPCAEEPGEDLEKATKTTKATKLKEKPTKLRHGPTKATNSSGMLIWEACQGS